MRNEPKHIKLESYDSLRGIKINLAYVKDINNIKNDLKNYVLID